MTPYPHTIKDGDSYRLCCNSCGQSVSTPFYPVKTDTPDGGLIVRAFIQCPECLERSRAPVAERTLPPDRRQ
jgi:hypothetical protein